MNKISIYSEYITLGQLLKFASIITNGGEVKFFLSENEVLVNDEHEERRGRKLYPGDIVKVLNNSYQIIKDENK